MKNIGFSLVEILVVIAIIGLISVIAAPAYQSYIIKSKVHSVVDVMDLYKDDALDYFYANGTFPLLSQMGVDASGGAANAPTDFSPYLAQFIVGPGDTCQSVGRVMVIFNASEIGLDPSAFVGVGMIFGEVNGTVQMYCGYPHTFNTPGTEVYLPTECTINIDTFDAIEAQFDNCP